MKLIKKIKKWFINKQNNNDNDYAYEYCHCQTIKIGNMCGCGGVIRYLGLEIEVLSVKDQHKNSFIDYEVYECDKCKTKWVF